MIAFCLAVASALTAQTPTDLPTPEPDPVWSEREVLAMGTRLLTRVRAPSRDEGLEILQEVHETVQRVEALLSTWRDDTELARLNRSPVGRPEPADPGLLALLVEVLEWPRATDGAFDPRTGALVDAWDLRGEGRRPSDEELEKALGASGPRALALDPVRGTITRLRAGAWVDPGGFGKGAALRRAEEHLRTTGTNHALLDFGGQILALGGPDGGWEVSVAHPARRHEAAALLRVSDRSVATSGASVRFVRVGGEPLGHIVDPRTGIPVSPWGSVTVVADDPMTADVLSTALFVLGAEEALRWAEGREEYGVLVLEEGPGGLTVRWNRGMEAHLARVPSKDSGKIHTSEKERIR